MRRGGRIGPRRPLLEGYSKRRGLIRRLGAQGDRLRRVELAPRAGGVVNRYHITGGAPGAGVGGGENIQQTLQIGDDAVGEDLRNLGRLSLQDGGLLTIDGAGAVTVTESYHEVTPLGTGIDDLDTINGAIDRQMIVLKRANGAGVMTVKHDTGNILCLGNADFDLDDDHDWAWFFREDTLATGTVCAMPGFGAGGGGGKQLKTIPFAATQENAQVETMLRLPGICIGESGEMGTVTGVRFKVSCGTAGVTGTMTVKLYADSASNFPSETEIASVDITTELEDDDTTISGWVPGTDNWLRVKITAIHSGTVAKNVVADFYYEVVEH